jgi:nucleoside-diphosphate-sugar epimerase
MPDPIFLTGGSGFVGRALITELTARATPVRALVRSDKAAATVRALGAEPVMGDLGAIDAMRAGMAGCPTIIHAAAKVDLWGKREDFFRDTIQGTRNALTAARDAGAARFLHIGTEAVLAGGAPIIRADETTPYPAVPNGLYPWSKGQAERDVIAANGENFATISLRPRFIWGRGDTTVTPQIARAMQSGAWAWFGGGTHLVSTCHVRNVVEGVLLAADRGAPGNIYFLTDGNPVVFREFVTRLAATQGVTAPAREAPLWVAELTAAAGEFVWSTFSLSGQPPLTRTALNLILREVTLIDHKARTDLGYTAHVSIDQGLAELAADHAAGKP